MSVLKSKKLWLTLIGLIVCIAVAYVMLALGLSEELVVKAVAVVATFFGLTIGLHGVTDIVSMLKGLQKGRDL